MLRRAVVALGLVLGLWTLAPTTGRAAPAVAAGIAASLPAPVVGTARYYRVYYVRRRYYRRRFYRPRYYRRRYYGYHYYRPRYYGSSYYRPRLWPFF